MELTTEIVSLLRDARDGKTTEGICESLHRSPQELGEAFEELRTTGAVLGFAGVWILPDHFMVAASKMVDALGRLHLRLPKVSYHPIADVMAAARLPWSGKPLDRALSLLQDEGLVVVSDAGLKLASFRLELTLRQRALLDRIVVEIEREPVEVPGTAEIARAIVVPFQAVDEMVKLGNEAGTLVHVAPGMAYLPTQLAAMAAKLRSQFEDKPFTTSEAKDALGTSRKYIVPILEQFDREKLTDRDSEDVRRFRA